MTDAYPGERNNMEPSALDAWLRAELSRRLEVTGVTLVAPPNAPAEPRGAIWLRWLPAETPLDEAAIRVTASDADALLVWLDAPSAPAQSDGWPQRLGWDDGFAPDTPPTVIATTLAREALALAAVRGGGSSPPCYL